MKSRLMLSVVCLALSGCSIVMSSKLPIARPPFELQPSVTRHYVDRRFGYPIAVGRTPDGRYVEEIQFVDGVPIGNKVARFCIHGTLDALTYCLWEFIGTPYEMMHDDFPTHVYFIVYNRDMEIESAHSLDSEEGRFFMTLPWAKPEIDGLRVNMDASFRESVHGTP